MFYSFKYRSYFEIAGHTVGARRGLHAVGPADKTISVIRHHRNGDLSDEYVFDDESIAVSSIYMSRIKVRINAPMLGKIICGCYLTRSKLVRNTDYFIVLKQSLRIIQFIYIKYIVI